MVGSNRFRQHFKRLKAQSLIADDHDIVDPGLGSLAGITGQVRAAKFWFHLPTLLENAQGQTIRTIVEISSQYSRHRFDSLEYGCIGVDRQSIQQAIDGLCLPLPQILLGVI